MSKLKLQCSAEPETVTLVCKRHPDDHINITTVNKDMGTKVATSVLLTKEDANVLANKLFSIAYAGE